MNDYSDIIDFPYDGVRSHPRTPVSDRGVIMSAFDALSGLGAEMDKTARLTEEMFDDMPDDSQEYDPYSF